MNKAYYSKTTVTKRELNQFGTDKDRFESFLRNSLLSNLIYQVEDEIEIKGTQNLETDTVEYKMELALLTVEEYNKLKLIQRKYKDELENK